MNIINIDQYTIDQLFEKLDSIESLLLNLKENLRTEKSPEYVRGKEVRKRLNISEGKLQSLRVNGHLNFSKVDGTIFYRLEDIVAMIESNQAVKSGKERSNG